MVTIDVGDEQRSIVTPELRLRFCRVGDRWTHSIDIRSGPWQAVAEAVEWDPAAEGLISPTYQEVQLQQDGAAGLALLIGQAGPHHFSASVRVTHRVLGRDKVQDLGQEYRESRVEFDVADRCRAEVGAVESHYLVREPPIVSLPSVFGDSDPAEEFVRDWRDSVAWGISTGDNDEVSIQGLGDPESQTRVALSDRIPSGGLRLRVAPRVVRPRGTNRIRYSWTLTRLLKHSSA